MGGDRQHLFAEPLACEVDRRREGDGAPARDGAESHGNGSGIGKRYHDIVRGDRPGIGDDLCEHRLHSLALRTGAAREKHLSRSVDPHRGALEKSDARALGVAADAKAEVTALAPRLALAATKRLRASKGFQRLANTRGEIAAVGDAGLAIA